MARNMVQKQSMATTTSEDTVTIDIQGLGRQLIRRLMAERNMRTAAVAKLLNVEAHTVRRMLNGSRAIALDELVEVARTGNYSLDELYGLSPSPAMQSAARQSNVNDGLGRVFSAIAELLSSAPAGSHNFESREELITQRRGEPAPREMVGRLSQEAQESLSRIVAGEGEKRKRGRPRKVA
jgi:plasmid maintenance system antidote protein VapI